MPRKDKTAKSPFAKACAVALSLALVVTMCPIVGFAEDSSRVDAVASEDAQAALLPVSDSEVDVPDDALSVSSNILPRMIRTASLVVAHPFPTKRFRMRMLRTSLLSLRMMLMWQKAPKIASQSQKRP